MATFAIHPPTGGIERVSGFQSQKPYTCVRSSNLWPIDVRDGRQLTATRPPQGGITFPSYPVNHFEQLNLPSPTCFASANGRLYKRDSSGTWNSISSSVGVSTGRAVYSAPYFRQMVIANNGAPLWYDDDNLATPLVELTATAGFVPDNCRLAANFQGSIWLGGSPTDDLGPHVFAAHRFGEIQDWNYSADDELAAYISTGEDRGLITEPLTAMRTVTADQMVLAAEEEIWIMSGHPRRGGRFDRVSNQSGVLGQNAFANTPRGFFFLAHDGLMFMARNDYANLTVTPISKSKIPDELLNIEYDILNPTVCMSYCSRWNAVYITVRSNTRPQSWMYFLETGGFTEQPIAENPIVMFPFESLVTQDTSGVLFGGQALKQFDRRATEEITSSQIIGPVKMSSDTLTANMVTEMSTLFAPGTTDDAATVELYVGPTGSVAVERAESRTNQYAYKTTVGRIRKNNRNWKPMLTGTAATLRIDQTSSTGRIVYEDSVGRLIAGGMNGDRGLVPPVITPPDVPLLEIDDN